MRIIFHAFYGIKKALPRWVGRCRDVTVRTRAQGKVQSITSYDTTGDGLLSEPDLYRT